MSSFACVRRWRGGDVARTGRVPARIRLRVYAAQLPARKPRAAVREVDLREQLVVLVSSQCPVNIQSVSSTPARGAHRISVAVVHRGS